MKLRIAFLAGGAAISLFAILGVAWVFSLPPAPDAEPASPVPEDEVAATLAALKPPKRQRPLIAVVGINEATETNDYLMPYGILRRSDVADVVALGTRPGPIKLFPALKVEPHATIAEFDAKYPGGADYVIVPAMSRDDDPLVLTWVRQQKEKGAIVVAVCAGAKVLAAAGLLDQRCATTHWFYLRELRRGHPAAKYVPDRRFVVDEGIATTTGISASIPMALTLIEAIAGLKKAEAVAGEIGVACWDARHRSSTFQFTRPFALTAMKNILAFWKRERFGIEMTPDMDEVSLGLMADAWSRTYRSRAFTYSRSGDAQMSRNGIRIYPDRTTGTWPARRVLAPIGSRPAQDLDNVLRQIAQRYGSSTAHFVAMQLEYPGRQSRPDDQALFQIALRGG